MPSRSKRIARFCFTVVERVFDILRISFVLASPDADASGRKLRGVDHSLMLGITNCGGYKKVSVTCLQQAQTRAASLEPNLFRLNICFKEKLKIQNNYVKTISKL